jgi:hypothetical protein
MNDKLNKEDFSEREPLPDIANILECIADYPLEGDPIRRSDYFRVIQKHTEKALQKIKSPLKIVI